MRRKYQCALSISVEDIPAKKIRVQSAKAHYRTKTKTKIKKVRGGAND